VGLTVPFNCTITGWVLTSRQTGSIVIDVWKSDYAGFPPVDGGTITGSAPPTLSSANKNQSTTLTGWTTTITAGDVLYFNVDSVTTIEECQLTLQVTKT
jgi:hypothetical protein